MNRKENPYTPGAGARPPLLAGRDGELDDFRFAFERLGAGRYARSFILDGLRGVGKTVLLNEADVIARELGWVSSGVVECNEDDDLPLLMARLCHRALRRLSVGRRVGARVERALGVLRRALPPGRAAGARPAVRDRRPQDRRRAALLRRSLTTAAPIPSPA